MTCTTDFNISGTISLTPVESSKLIVIEGDSLSTSYPSVLQDMLDSSWQVVTAAISGTQTAAMLTQAQTIVDWRYTPNNSKNVYVFWGGTGDLAIGGSVESTYQNIVDACQGRRLAGFRVIVILIAPRTAATLFGPTFAEFEARRLQLNALINANYTQFADGVYDPNSDPRLLDPADTTYYSDGVHMTTAGYTIIAEGVFVAIEDLLDGRSTPDLLTDLSAAYKFDEREGTRYDSHTNGLNLTPYNNPLYSPGLNSNALLLLSTSSHRLDREYSTVLDFGDEDFGVNVEVALHDKPALPQVIVGIWDGVALSWVLYWDNTVDRFGFATGDGAGGISGSVFANALGVPALFTKYTVCAWYDPTANVVGIRVNDQYQTTAALIGTHVAMPGRFTVGSNGGGTGYITGRLDNLLVYKKALSNAEKTRLHRLGNGIAYPFLN